MMDNVLDSDTIISTTFNSHQTRTNSGITSHTHDVRGSQARPFKLSNNMSQLNNKLVKLLGMPLLSENDGPHSLVLGITTPIIGAPMAGASGGMNH